MRSLSTRLILAFAMVSVLGTLLVAAYLGLTTTRQFSDYVMDQYVGLVAGNWAAHYVTNGTWDYLSQELPQRPTMLESQTKPRVLSTHPRSSTDSSQRDKDTPKQFRGVGLVDAEGIVLVEGVGYRIGDRVPREVIADGTPIVVEDALVGTLISMPSPQVDRTPMHDRFLGSFYTALAVGSIGATLLALVTGVLLARSLTKPVRELTDATQAMAQGNLAQRIPVRSKDELGELAQSFNAMSAELTHAEDLRKQMTADIAHELRTPLSLILGHAEALSDGVLPPTPETFEVIHDEAQHLTHLVQDLRILSLSDARRLPLNREPTSPADLVEAVVTAHTPGAQGKHITIQAVADNALPNIDVDTYRFTEVLNNLITNSLRHTPADGAITVRAVASDEHVHLSVTGTGPGVPDDELPHIFERFYRGDVSRHRDTDGSGLGLAIAKSITESHGGTIRADNASTGGLVVTIELPACVTSIAA